MPAEQKLATVTDRRYNDRMPERLRRLEWLYRRVPIYFVTTCASNRRPLLTDTAFLHHALIVFGEAGAERGAWLGAYVLMPDHLHAFVGFNDPRIELSGWMKSLKNTLSKALQSKGVPAPHWQKGFFDHVPRSEESYEGKWNYVRENPVRAGLVVMFQ